MDGETPAGPILRAIYDKWNADIDADDPTQAYLTGLLYSFYQRLSRAGLEDIAYATRKPLESMSNEIVDPAATIINPNMNLLIFNGNRTTLSQPQLFILNTLNAAYYTQEPVFRNKLIQELDIDSNHLSTHLTRLGHKIRSIESPVTLLSLRNYNNTNETVYFLSDPLTVNPSIR